MSWEYQVVKLPDVPRFEAEGWLICGYDPRYLPSFGSVWMRRRVK